MERSEIRILLHLFEVVIPGGDGFFQTVEGQVEILLPLGLFRLGETVMFSPRGLSPWFNGFCTTPNSREIRVEQKPLNHRRKVGGEIITRSER